MYREAKQYKQYAFAENSRCFGIALTKSGFANAGRRTTGFDFEIFCEQKLTNEGWVVTKTKSGADQGLDLIAQKGKQRIGIQCKKYARPVGNKAVQEVISGLQFYNNPQGAVLTNNTFTKSAIQLANASNI